MSASYGTLFADRWRGMNLREVKGAWASRLADLSPAEIKRGLDSLGSFPPTLPEFALLCRPKPNPEAAHAEACRLIGQLVGWSDCSVFWAAREIGYHDLKVLRYQDIRGRWIDALERAWTNRRPIPEPAPVAGQIAADTGKEPRKFTDQEREEIWERIKSVGKDFARKREPLQTPPAGLRADVAIGAE